MSRTIFLASLWILALVLLMCAGFAVPLDLLLNLAFGWIFYVTRVLPRVEVGWAGVATAVVCLALFAVGFHQFASWLYSRSEMEGRTVREWRPRWTVALVGTIVLMFVAGIATVGMAHQAGWLLTAREPLIGTGSLPSIWRAQSINNLKQIGLALHNYHSQQGAFPAGGTFDGQGHPLHGWQTMILPFCEQGAVYDQVHFDLPWDDPSNAMPFRTVVVSWLNPGIPPRTARDEAGYALSHYAGNARVLGARSLSLAEIKDGTSETILAGEVPTGFKAWGYPANWRDPSLGVNKSPRGFGGPFVGGANFLFADGSIRFLKDTIDPKILKSLSTPEGGESVPSDAY